MSDSKSTRGLKQTDPQVGEARASPRAPAGLGADASANDARPEITTVPPQSYRRPSPFGVTAATGATDSPHDVATLVVEGDALVELARSNPPEAMEEGEFARSGELDDHELRGVTREDALRPSIPSRSGIATRDDVAAMRELYARGDAIGALRVASSIAPPPLISEGSGVDHPDASVAVELGGEVDLDLVLLSSEADHPDASVAVELGAEVDVEIGPEVEVEIGPEVEVGGEVALELASEVAVELGAEVDLEWPSEGDEPRADAALELGASTTELDTDPSPLDLEALDDPDAGLEQGAFERERSLAELEADLRDEGLGDALVQTSQAEVADHSFSFRVELPAPVVAEAARGLGSPRSSRAQLLDRIPPRASGVTLQSALPGAGLTLSQRQSVPRSVKSPAELAKLPIDPRGGFLLSIVDGTQTLEEILDVCAMPGSEAMEILKQLEALGVIVFD